MPNGRGLPAIERFRQRYRVDEATGCWVWTAGTNDGGYGRFTPSRAEGAQAAHRWSYVHHVGPIADGLTIDHRCRVRLCVNPAHLEAVTLRENLLRGNTAAARNAAKTRCPQGHPYDGTNKRGARTCSTCHREQALAWRSRQ